jgi:hypothetical protein
VHRPLLLTPSHGKAHTQETRDGARPRSQDSPVSHLQDAFPKRLGWRARLPPLQSDREVAHWDLLSDRSPHCLRKVY